MSDSLVNVTVEPKELVITLIDSSSTTVELNPNPVEVTINSAVQNTVTVTLGGGRGAVWLPDGSTYDGASLAAILAGHISKTQLANDLAEEIELTSTGLIEAQADLQGAINTLLATGDILDDSVSRMEIVEDTIVLQSSRLDDVELNITTARVDIDDSIIRLTAAETSLTDNSNYIVTQQSILSNEWTVKIFENTDGSMCSAGIGLLVYPAWKVNSVYEIGDYCWFDDSVYKSRIVHISSESITPANSSYWQLIPYGTKSQFGVLADTFFVQTQKDGDVYTPFVIYEDQVVINGDMLVNGLISANLISASGIATWSLQSQNYVSGSTGYSLNAATGEVEFNNMSFTINYGDIVDAPDLTNYVTTTILNNNIAAIQAQIDGNFTIWYYPGTPTLSNEPAVNWTDNTLKDLHLGDQYYNETTGTVYRFKYENSTYFWFELPNTDLSLALASAATAQDTADNKRRVFVVQPTGPYDIGDLWVDGSIVKYANIARTSGYTSGDWLNTASLGAPIGTLVAGVSASTIATAATNFNSSNDRNSTSIVLPTLAIDGTCVDHTVRANGSVDISFEWLWSGTEGDIDGFQILVYTSTSSNAYIIGSSVVNETVYTIPAQKRVFILYGVVPNVYYTFAVRAYRSVDKDINASGVITSNWVKSTYSGENPYQPSSSVAFSGNITGTVNNIPVANVNVWSAITGSDKPADNAIINYNNLLSAFTVGRAVFDQNYNINVPTNATILNAYKITFNTDKAEKAILALKLRDAEGGINVAINNINLGIFHYGEVYASFSSTTTHTIEIGTKVFTTSIPSQNSLFTIGDTVEIATNTSNILTGTIISFIDNALTVNVHTIVGTGSYSSWAIRMPNNSTFTHLRLIDLVSGINELAIWASSTDGCTLLNYTVRTASATNTSQLSDDAGLGTTAIWDLISGTGKPTDNADNTQTSIDNTLDTTTGGIIVRDNTLNRYAHFTGGDLTFYDYVNSAWVAYKAVTKTVSNVCSDGEIVNLGYFREEPIVQISPYLLDSYNATYNSQSQKFFLNAANLRETSVGSKQWQFDAVAKLLLSENTTTLPTGYSTNVASAFSSSVTNGQTRTVTSSYLTLPANTYSVTCNCDIIRDAKKALFVYKVSAKITIFYEIAGVWYESDPVNLSKEYSNSKLNNISISTSQASPMQRIYIKTIFTIYNERTLIEYYGVDAFVCSQRFISATCILASATISAEGQALYTAIG